MVRGLREYHTVFVYSTIHLLMIDLDQYHHVVQSDRFEALHGALGTVRPLFVTSQSMKSEAAVSVLIQTLHLMLWNNRDLYRVFGENRANADNHFALGAGALGPIIDFLQDLGKWACQPISFTGISVESRRKLCFPVETLLATTTHRVSEIRAALSDRREMFEGPGFREFLIAVKESKFILPVSFVCCTQYHSIYMTLILGRPRRILERQVVFH